MEKSKENMHFISGFTWLNVEVQLRFYLSVLCRAGTGQMRRLSSTVLAFVTVKRKKKKSQVITTEEN